MGLLDSREQESSTTLPQEINQHIRKLCHLEDKLLPCKVTEMYQLLMVSINVNVTFVETNCLVEGAEASAH